MFVIDAHCHIYPEAIAQKAANATGAFYDGLPSTCSGKVEALLKTKIDHFLVQSVSTKPAQVGSINRFILEQVGKYPDKLTGLATLHPYSETLEEDISQMLSMDFHGLKLHPDIQHFPLDCPQAMTIFEACRDNNLPVLLHTGDKRYDYSNYNRLEPVLKAFPTLLVVGAHFGGYSMWEEAIPKLTGYDNYVVDCSSVFFTLSNEQIMDYTNAYGIDRVMFGSDYPMWNPDVDLDRFFTLPFSHKEQEKILSQNAIQYYKMEGVVR